MTKHKHDPRALSPQLNYPYLAGVYLFVSAVKDLYLLVDGPRCVYQMVDVVCRRHDLAADVFPSAGKSSRIISTDVELSGAAEDAAARVLGVLDRLTAGNAAVGGVLAGSMPMPAVTGVPYAAIIKRAGPRYGFPLHFLPSGSLSGDWLDGYAQAMSVLASDMKLRTSSGNKKTVAIVGHMFSRGEPEEQANILEMRRLLCLCGIELVSVWPAGGSVSALKRVQEASLLVSHPFARQAAGVLTAKLKIPGIELQMPLGFAGTRRWLTAIADFFGCRNKAAAVIESEMREVAPHLEWLVQYALKNKRIAFAGDPHSALAFKEICADFGARLDAVLVCGKKDRRFPELEKNLRVCEYAVPQALINSVLSGPGGKYRPDLLVGNTSALAGWPEGAVMEFGFPSLFRHSVARAPYYCFQGAAMIAERMAKEILGQELNTLRRRRSVLQSGE